MKASSRTVCALVFLIGLLAASGSSAGSAQDAEVIPPPKQNTEPYTAAERHEVRVSEAMAFRRDHGFESDRAYVESLEVARDKYPEAVKRFGLPLMASELAAMDKIDQLDEDAQAVRRAVEASRIPFGGLWIAPNEQQLYVAVTSAPDLARSIIVPAMRDDKALQVVQVEHSLSALERLQRSIAADVARNPEWDVTQISLATQQNRVIVHTAASGVGLRDALKRSHPDAPFTVNESDGRPELASYAQENSVPPMLAGLRIIREGYAQCSAAFSAKAEDSTNKFQLTAGHCGNGSFYHDRFLVDDYVIGPTQKNAYKNGSAADVQKLDIRNGDHSALVYEPNGFQTIRDVQGTSTEGSTACISGWGGDYYLGDGKRCGTVRSNAEITTTQDPFTGNLKFLYSQAEVGLVGCPGDSGGPIYNNSNAKGILSAGIDENYPGPCGKPTYYSQARGMQDELSVRIFTE